jgi:hypothetical protein
MFSTPLWCHCASPLPLLRHIAVALVLASLARAQTTQDLYPDLRSSSTGAITGMAQTDSAIHAATSGTTFVFNYTVSNTPTTFLNSGGVVDAGATRDALKTIELYNNGTFGIFRNDTRFNVGGGSIAGVASSTWGISDTFTNGAAEFVAMGYVDLGTGQNKVGIYNLNTNTFTPAFTIASGTPTGLANYTGVGGTSTEPAHQIFAVSMNNNSVLDYTSGGTLSRTSNLFTDTGTTVGDIAFASGYLYAGFGNSVEAYSWTGVAAVPEPATTTALTGAFALAIATWHHRRRRSASTRSVR